MAFLLLLATMRWARLNPFAYFSYHCISKFKYILSNNFDRFAFTLWIVKRLFHLWRSLIIFREDNIIGIGICSSICLWFLISFKALTIIIRLTRLKNLVIFRFNFWCRLYLLTSGIGIWLLLNDRVKVKRLWRLDLQYMSSIRSSSWWNSLLRVSVTIVIRLMSSSVIVHIRATYTLRRTLHFSFKLQTWPRSFSCIFLIAWVRILMNTKTVLGLVYFILLLLWLVLILLFLSKIEALLTYTWIWHV